MAFRAASQVAAGSASTAAPAVPTGTAENDIVLVGIYTEAAPTITPPAGFNEITEWVVNNNGGTWFRGYWKRAGAGESGTYSFALGVTTIRAAFCCAYSGRISSGTPYSAGDAVVNTLASYGPYPTVAVTTDVDGCELVYGGTNFDGSATTQPTSFNERIDAGYACVSDLIQTSAGATGNINIATNVQSPASVLVALLPEPLTYPLISKVSTTDTGFTAGHPFTSGEAKEFTVQAGDELADGTYYWRVRAIDPSGSNSYGAWSTIRSFTVAVGGGSFQSAWAVNSNQVIGGSR